MSAVEDAPATAPVPVVREAPAVGSLSDRLARARQRRQEREKTPLTLIVPGTDGGLAATYRQLDFDEQGDVAHEHLDLLEKNRGADRAAADSLIRSCIDLLEVIDPGEIKDGKVIRPPEYRSLGMKWYTEAISELFEIEFEPKTGARAALLEALGQENVVRHFNELNAEIEKLKVEAGEKLPGESEPSAEGI